MTNRVLLNNVDHADLTVRHLFGAAFGDQVNSVRLFPTEYEAAAREYPILFRQDPDSGQLLAVALLGLDADENLFLADDRWDARYVPAVQARGPFSIGLQRNEDGTPADALIHVDLEDDRVGRGQDGNAVFLPHGGNSPYLERMSDVLRTLSDGLELEPAMFAAFTEFGLIRPVQLQVQVSDTRRYDLTDFLTIDTAKLSELDGDALVRLNRFGFLRLAFAVAASLGNIGRLIDIKNRRDAA